VRELIRRTTILAAFAAFIIVLGWLVTRYGGPLAP
jgi:hypothetical protein